MRRGPTGTHEVDIAGGEAVRAFVPHALPPEPPLDITSTRRRLLERATLALGRLDSVTLLLPDPDLFLYSYVRREAVLSSQIEGTQSSLSDLLLFELEELPGVPLDDVVEVSNYVAALEHGMRRLREGFPLCNRLLREIHAELLARGRGSDKSPGEFRRTQNWIGGTRPGNAQFVPPPPRLVDECMSGLERYLHADDGPYPVLITAALVHVQFETIHPFLDGNGRIGRLLIALLLHAAGVLAQPLLYLSLYFKRHRGEYYRLLSAVRVDGDWESWVDFFLEGVEQTANEAVRSARALVDLFEADSARVHTLGRSTSTVLRVHQALRHRPALTIREAASRTGLSFPTVSKAIDKLTELGIVHEYTGNRRNRVFAYTAYLRLLSEETEMPLRRAGA